MPDNQSNDRKEEKISAEQTEEITPAAEPCETENTESAEAMEGIPDETPDTIPEETPTEATEGTDAESADESHDAEETDVTESATPPCPAPDVISDESKNEKRKASRRGALVYAAIMTAAFLVCFALLIAITVTAPPAADPDYAPVETIVIEKTVYVRDGDSTGKLTVAEIASKVGPSVVGIGVRTKDASGVGTGIIKTEDGYIITNYHVIEDYTSIEVFMPDGTSYPAEYIGGNELSDIAVIKIAATGLPAADFGNSDGLVVGETAVAIGTPGGLEYAGTVTTGIISSTRRIVYFYDNTTRLLQKTMTLIQTSTQINPGNSGGPLIDGDGKVIGINTYKITEDGFEGIGFAIPINGVLAIYDDILAGGNGNVGNIAKKAARLGITGAAVTKGSKFTYSDGAAERTVIAETDGIAVASADPGYDAAAKLRPGDIITAIDGHAVRTIDDVRASILSLAPGDKITLTVFRDGTEMTVDVTLGG